MKINPHQSSGGARRRRHTKAERMEYVASWKRSGESAHAYAKAHDLSSSNLYAWSSKERQSSGEGASTGSAFVPVRIAPAAMGTHMGSRVTLRANGFECVIEDTHGPEALASLAEVLKRKVFDV
jgi:transposase-like protein